MTKAEILNMTILLVEDLKVTQKIHFQALTRQGFKNIMVAGDGDEAIACLESHPNVDLIISDWNMPNRSGLEFLKWIRGHPVFEKIPFIMATAQADKDRELEILEAGGQAVVVKPFKSQELMSKIHQALGVEADTLQKELAPSATILDKPCLRITHIQITDHLILGVMRHLILNNPISPDHFELETLLASGEISTVIFFRKWVARIPLLKMHFHILVYSVWRLWQWTYLLMMFPFGSCSLLTGMGVPLFGTAWVIIKNLSRPFSGINLF